MQPLIPTEVLAAFFPNHAPARLEDLNVEVQVVGDGLIHRSFRADDGTEVLFLQQLNTRVFPEPGLLEDNYKIILRHCNNTQQQTLLPAPRFTGEGMFVRDQAGGWWRAFDFINNACSYESANAGSHAGTIAKAFARFTIAFDGFDAGCLKETIPGFHDLSMRFQHFKSALQQDPRKRAAACHELIQQLLQRFHYCDFYHYLRQSPAFQKRVMHHDAKAGNVLFNRENGQFLCLVDFDTVMPGYFFSDLGDMIRSMTATTTEDDAIFQHIGVDTWVYEQLLDGYLTGMGQHLSAEEKEHIHHSGLILTYMQALRFLADYLLGDPYYRIDYPHHNRVRAENQLVFLQQLESMISSRYNFRV